MNPTLPLWVLAVGATPTFTPAPDPLPGTELAQISARWSRRFKRVPAAPEARPSAGTRRNAERIEALLDAAQTALGSLRPDEAKAALTDAEALLRAHPELPQAAWLAAERASIAAELASAEGEPASARLRAFVLEGRRATPFREGTLSGGELPALPAIALSVRGLAATDELEWDATRSPSRFETLAGEHQLRVLRNERLLWASWVEVTESTHELALNLPALAPCSADDLERTRDAERAPVAAATTLCSRWAVARGAADEVEISFCERSRCGEWQRAPRAPTMALRQPAAHPLIPSWALYVAGGLGAVAIGGLIAAESGAFSSEPARERWRYEGLR
jgi:hypothetical protein